MGGGVPLHLEVEEKLLQCLLHVVSFLRKRIKNLY
jgi:hypothetical protein